MPILPSGVNRVLEFAFHRLVVTTTCAHLWLKWSARLWLTLVDSKNQSLPSPTTTFVFRIRILRLNSTELTLQLCMDTLQLPFFIQLIFTITQSRPEYFSLSGRVSNSSRRHSTLHEKSGRSERKSRSRAGLALLLCAEQWP